MQAVVDVLVVYIHGGKRNFLEEQCEKNTRTHRQLTGMIISRNAIPGLLVPLGEVGLERGNGLGDGGSKCPQSVNSEWRAKTCILTRY